MFVEALIRLLIAEHKRRPIRGEVLALGKQSVAVSIERLLELFAEQGCSVSDSFDKTKATIDTTTRVRSEGSPDDSTLFSMFGNVSYSTMDVSAYENAGIIHNLNHPIPDNLEGKFDFIIDGGTFDHLFDIRVAFENVVRLLKSNGRVFQWNAASNYANKGYLSFSADFFRDYYILNRFAGCRTFFAESYSIDAQNWYVYEFDPTLTEIGYPGLRPSSAYVMVLVLAEKQKDSSFHRMPIQAQYRDPELRDEYLRNVKALPTDRSMIIAPKSWLSQPYVSRRVRLKRALGLAAPSVVEQFRWAYERGEQPDPKVYKFLGWL